MIARLPQEFIDHSLFHHADAAQRIEQLRPSGIPSLLRVTDSRIILKDRFAEGLDRCVDSRNSQMEEVTRYLFLCFNWLRRQSKSADSSPEWISGRIQLIRSLIAELHQGLCHRESRRLASTNSAADLLLCEANWALLKAINSFDVGRGFQFSTYGTRAIRNHLYRVLQKERRNASLGSGAVCVDDIPDNRTAGLRSGQDELRIAGALQSEMASLDNRTRMILTRRFGLEPGSAAVSYQQIGDDLGLSKERVRQLTLRALRKLRGGLAKKALQDDELCDLLDRFNRNDCCSEVSEQQHSTLEFMNQLTRLDFSSERPCKSERSPSCCGP